MTKQRAILLAGPTASGKSALALFLAQKHNGVVINADSMQVYRDLRILTARPSVDDEIGTPHALYGHVAGDVAYSVGRYLVEAEAAIAAAWAAGRLPVIVGGTGLYFQGLLQGLSPVPEIPETIRAHWRQAGAGEDGARRLYEQLTLRDPEMAERLDAGDRQRVTRALEVIDATGVSLAEWQREGTKGVLDGVDNIRLWLDVPRAEIYARCDARFLSMIEAGAIEEVRRLLDQKLNPGLPIMRALGVSALTQVIRGESSLEDAIQIAQQATRHYVKRQTTWARRNMITWKHVNMKLLDSIYSDNFSIIDFRA